jgi:Secretion system C-terminal sorting domain
MKINIKKYSVIFFIVFFFNIQNLISQSSDIKEFLPLNIGNTWVYYYDGAWPFGNFSGFEKYKIISTYYAHGKTYFKFAHFRVAISGPSNVVLQSRLFKDTAAIRIDSLSGNIYRNDTCHSSQEMPVDSLKARLNDTSITCEPAVDDTVICSDTNSYIYFDTLRISRKFEMPGFEGQTIQIYAKNLGLVGYTFQIMNQITWGTLKGCVINGVVYGDTGLVGIKRISNEIPRNFSLSQNYPNPFNPVTKIKFDIPLDSRLRGNDNVTLRIYDILGREVAVLINEELKPGTYEVEWDASTYPSGVYFYKLITQNYSETRKMVLLK